MAPKSKVYPVEGVRPVVTPMGAPPPDGVTPLEVTVTTKQRAVYDYIRTYAEERGFPPTIRELAAHFKCTKSGIQEYLEVLKKKGLLRHIPRSARALIIVSGVVVTTVDSGRGGHRGG